MLSSVQEVHLPSLFVHSMEVKSDLVPHNHTYTHSRHMNTVNASLNCIYPPKCAPIKPEGSNTDGDEDQCVSVAVSAYLRDKMETLQGDENRE